jgi:hypothetical protein
MPSKLIITVIIVSLLFLLYICKNVKNGFLSTKHSLVWVFVSILIIVFSLTQDILLKMASFFGIVTVSNMLFFSGFVFLIFITFNLTKIVSKLNKEIIVLTQELGILKNEIKSKNK